MYVSNWLAAVISPQALFAQFTKTLFLFMAHVRSQKYNIIQIQSVILLMLTTDKTFTERIYWMSIVSFNAL